jgi:hypothetical protein
LSLIVPYIKDLCGIDPPRRLRTSKEKQMGRPLNKRWFGRLADADDSRFAPKNDTFFNITISAKVGTNDESSAAYILRQRSTTKFLVNDLKTGTNTDLGDSTAQGSVGICKLVDKAAGTLAANEMIIEGFVAGAGEAVRVKKLYNRTCRDFDNNRYTWEIQDDSTVTILVLTAL